MLHPLTLLKQKSDYQIEDTGEIYLVYSHYEMAHCLFQI